jgi:membrane protein involved in colicin uptake
VTDEERERIKADEKEHLRKVKALKEAARRLQRTKKTQQAADDVDRARDKLDENSALVRPLREEAARGETRLDLALETRDDDAAAGDSEARAKALVRRLRDEMHADANDEDGATPPPDNAASPDDDRPDKTIGPAR